MFKKRIWIAFKAVKRDKPRSVVLGYFAALTPTSSSWLTTMGSYTYFDICAVDRFSNYQIGSTFSQVRNASIVHVNNTSIT